MRLFISPLSSWVIRKQIATTTTTTTSAFLQKAPAARTAVSLLRHYSSQVAQNRTNTNNDNNKKRDLSSVVVAVEEEEDDEDENDNVVVEQQSKTTTRPRLEELKRKLQQDDVKKLSQFRRTTTTTTTITTTTSKDADTSSSSSSSSLKSIDELIASLPDPPILDHAAHPTQILTDQHNRMHNYLRLSLTEKCNLRCQYCMPEDGVPLQPPSHILTTPELITIARHFMSWGVDKIRLTGGEPTLRKDLIEIVQGISNLQTQHFGFSKPNIGMTTNGVTLYKLIPDLVQAGLTSVNISLDTLQPDKFATLTRRPASYFHRVWKSIETTLQYMPLKINVVVMRGINDDEIQDFIQLAQTMNNTNNNNNNYNSSSSSSNNNNKQQKQHLLQVRFIEYMPFTDNGWNWDQCIPYREIVQQHSDVLYAIPSPDPHDTTKWYGILNHNNKDNNNNTTTPQIGFITSMSHNFCSTCNRLRISADGQIKVCLFDGRDNGIVSLRDAIRHYQNTKNKNNNDDVVDRVLQKIVYHAVQTKHAKLGGHADPLDIQQDSNNNRPMTLIGG